MRQYKVGDKVTIRSWESMEREFGLNENGSVNIPPYFTKEMKEHCGKQATISCVYSDSRYDVKHCGWLTYIPQMFTDWETDNAKEMKMQYHGQEVELITEGYWPEGATLICSDDGKNWEVKINLNAIVNNRAISIGATTRKCNYWAVLPTKPAPRRLTNREVAKLCRAGWSLLDGEWVYAHASYKKQYENDPAPQGMLLRAPNTDEWLEPTSDLLEGTK